MPKALEMDPSLDPIFNPPGGQHFVDLTISDCASITLMDKAHDSRGGRSFSGARDEKWDQSHTGVAFKFREESGNGNGKSWHCVWATLAEYDGEDGPCVFRSYDDVYLERLQRSPQRSPKKRSPRKPTARSRGSGGDWNNRN